MRCEEIARDKIQELTKSQVLYGTVRSHTEVDFFGGGGKNRCGRPWRRNAREGKKWANLGKKVEKLSPIVSLSKEIKFFFGGELGGIKKGIFSPIILPMSNLIPLFTPHNKGMTWRRPILMRASVVSRESSYWPKSNRSTPLFPPFLPLFYPNTLSPFHPSFHSFFPFNFSYFPLFPLKTTQVLYSFPPKFHLFLFLSTVPQFIFLPP